MMNGEKEKRRKKKKTIMSMSSSVRHSIDIGRWMHAQLYPNSQSRSFHTMRRSRRAFTGIQRTALGMSQKRHLMNLFQGKERRLKQVWTVRHTFLYLPFI
jgi:hypothetical protein